MSILYMLHIEIKVNVNLFELFEKKTQVIMNPMQILKIHGTLKLVFEVKLKRELIKICKWILKIFWV
jgi:hypothetical protein